MPLVCYRSMLNVHNSLKLLVCIIHLSSSFIGNNISNESSTALTQLWETKKNVTELNLKCMSELYIQLYLWIKLIKKLFLCSIYLQVNTSVIGEPSLSPYF